MATTFKVDPQQLKTISQTYAGSRQKCESYAKQIMNIASTLKGSWQSDAANMFYSKLQGIQGDIGDINRIINEHVNDLLKIAGVYDKTDTTVKSQASALKSDVLNY